MNAEIDHLFVLCDVDAPEANALTKLGFEEGLPNTHPGQGTACRRFFFRNAYLELVWVSDPAETRRDPARRLGLWERWNARREGACPFGVILRPRSARDAAPPFATWSYMPAYLPVGLSIQVALDALLTDPAFFWLGFRRAGDTPQVERSAQKPGRSITRVRIGTPAGRPSGDAARAAEALGVLTFRASTAYVLELTLDAGSHRRSIDVRPTLPLVFDS